MHFQSKSIDQLFDTVTVGLGIVGPEDRAYAVCALAEIKSRLGKATKALGKIASSRGADRAAEHSYCVMVASQAEGLMK